jgi:hypothetical protein
MSYKFNPFTATLDYVDTDRTIRVVYLAGENINVPTGKVLQLHSPSIDGEIIPDGEVFIL